MNSLSFTGNLGKDAEQKTLPDGTSIVSMSVPCKAGFGDRAVTTWLRCSMFGPRGAAVMPYLLKGALVGITGEFSAREYTDRDGAKKQSLEVRVNDLTLLGGRKDSQAAPDVPQRSTRPSHDAAIARSPAPAKASNGFDDMESDIPF